jgi:ATP-dependent DNA helicase RecG
MQRNSLRCKTQQFWYNIDMEDLTMGRIERDDLEYKQSVSNTFLKTVSAFANYRSGEIVFGISDEGEIIGLSNLDETCLIIENKINHSISPVPEYTISINESNNTISLNVNLGVHKPYLYKNKAYKRSDTSTVEIDRIELNRLILEGTNRTYEEMPAYNNELSFNYLENKLVEKLGIHKLNEDIMKTLDFYFDENKYNRAAELLSDSNSYPGIDMVRFGETIDEFLDREIIEGISILEQFEKAIRLFEKYYVIDEIIGSERVRKELVPEKAFREALANAIVHRLWDLRSSITISMYENRVEIVSPGGLPTGMSKEEYIDGQISLLRNPILGNLFFRLRYIEKFGTGIKRIKQAYKDAFIHPDFKVYPNSITIVLPVIKKEAGILSEEEQVVYQLLTRGKSLSRKEVENRSGLNKSKTIRILNKLLAKNAIEVIGQGRSIRYKRIAD